MKDEEEFKATIVEKYTDHFNHCYRLHQFVQVSLQNSKWFTKTIMTRLSCIQQNRTT